MAAAPISSDLTSLAIRLLDNGPRKISYTNRRVRVLLNHTYIVDTTSAVHVWEHDNYPQYYIPTSQLQNCTFSILDRINSSDGTEGASLLSVNVIGPKNGDPKFTDRVIAFDDDKKRASQLAGMCRLEFNSMDQWFEEETPIYVHPKDPFKRIDILPSSRQITIELDGHTLATAYYSLHLHETGLPTRYYVPYTSVNIGYLRHSNLMTKCPYKGDAEYFHVVYDEKEYRNMVWWYRIPTAESASVAGLLCFYNEKVDIKIDGVLQDRPKTHFV